MGICRCKKHGRAEIVEVCQHAAGILGEGLYGQFHCIQIFGTLLVCDECLRKYELAHFQSYPSYFETKQPDENAVEAYLEIHQRLEGRGAVCSECAAAAEVAEARRDGRPDPFRVFERTLTENHRDVLNDLTARLTGAVEFQFSVVYPTKRQRALFICGGNYREPMTVTVYYVTSAEEQDRIVSLVTNFLADLELDQAKIVFFEAENWITWSNPESGASGGSRGKETLLHEVFVNCI